MSFRPDTAQKIVQDMPPPGGFPSVDITKTARARGPPGALLWVGSSLLIGWGFYRVGLMNHENSGEKLAEREARYAMIPVLQAEEDRWYVFRERELIKEEARIMKDVPGWVPGESVYHGNRWVPRQNPMLDINIKK